MHVFKDNLKPIYFLWLCLTCIILYVVVYILLVFFLFLLCLFYYFCLFSSSCKALCNFTFEKCHMNKVCLLDVCQALENVYPAIQIVLVAFYQVSLWDFFCQPSTVEVNTILPAQTNSFSNVNRHLKNSEKLRNSHFAFQKQWHGCTMFLYSIILYWVLSSFALPEMIRVLLQSSSLSELRCYMLYTS